MAYVDGFLLPVPKKKLKAYAALSKKMGKIWREHGALAYRECVGDDMNVMPGCGLAFPDLMKLKPGHVAVFSFIVYKSRKHRDAVNKNVMSDKRLANPPKTMPFDMNSMCTGGFKVFVDV
ncbi:MAG: DUF1428 domain-containing protein [Planctomycetes bacterium]|nr:DUF1428 domain-containing protein [Planctomycetota bacterium]